MRGFRFRSLFVPPFLSLFFSLFLPFKRRCTLPRQGSSPSRPTRCRSLPPPLLVLVPPPPPPPPPSPSPRLCRSAAIPSRSLVPRPLLRIPPRSSPGASLERRRSAARRSQPPEGSPAAEEEAGEAARRRAAAVGVAESPLLLLQFLLPHQLPGAPAPGRNTSSAPWQRARREEPPAVAAS